MSQNFGIEDEYENLGQRYVINVIKSINNTETQLLLYRFGINVGDIRNYIVGNYNRIDNKRIIHKYFVILKKQQRCIEINIDPITNKISNATITILENEIINTYPIILGCNEPFMKLLPIGVPYICYKKDDHHYVNIITSSTAKKNNGKLKSKSEF